MSDDLREQLRQREEEVVRLNKELEDTNRGVVALYAELDEKADFLRRASEIKTRFLANMSHEFRTPLNSILSLSRMLLDRLDGELTAEQDKQVTFIRRAAENLSELVNDLLDIAKVEAGKIAVRAAPFTVGDLFSALRGMLRPLLTAQTEAALVFDEPVDLPELTTDEGKVSQILRNLVSNALKFTERGEVRVVAHQDGENVVVTVRDTGIGIAPADQGRIFEEFVQVENALQRKYTGTGLGLPLSRKLAQLLGGTLNVASAPGQGSTFTLTLPLRYAGPAEEAEPQPESNPTLDPARLPVLAVEDNRETLFVYERYLQGTPFQLVPAATVAEARQVLQRLRPVAVIMDILLQGENTWGLLTELKEAEATRRLPVFVVTVVDNSRKALALGADDFCLKPVEREWLLSRLRACVPSTSDKVLVIDDDEIARYLIKSLLARSPYQVGEAGNGQEGLERARRDRPRAIFLDLSMPGLSGFEVLDALQADPATRRIPVIVITSRAVSDADRVRLAAATAILSKNTDSRDQARAAVLDALHKAGLEAERPALATQP